MDKDGLGMARTTNPHSFCGQAIVNVRNRRVTNEVPTGTGTTFTLAYVPITGTLDFMVNGLLLKAGSGAGTYSLTGAVVTTATTYDADAEVLASYER
jgi:hypothetical protein